MVLGRIMMRGGGHNPVAAAKAFGVTALLYAVSQAIPEKTLNSWLHWAGTPAARVPMFFLVVFFLVVVPALISQREALWQYFFFDPIPKTKSHTGCLIWLHGVGDRGSGFMWLRDEFSMQGLQRVKVALPTAPDRAVSVVDGGKRRAWFDLTKMPIELDEPDDPEGLKASVASVLALVEDQIADGIRPERIVLGGFSQGAAVAAWAAAECPHRLAGVVLWSGYAPRHADLSAALGASANRAGTPFVLAHGDSDPKVRPACGKRLADAIDASGVKVRSQQVYEGLGHGCTREQLAHLVEFLTEVIPPPPQGAWTEAAKKEAVSKGLIRAKAKKAD